MKKIITAHNLRSGAVVYRAPSGGWTERLMEAARYDPGSAELDASLRAAREAEVVNAYAMEIDAAGPAGRTRLRERIRASGPTVRPDLARRAGPAPPRDKEAPGAAIKTHSEPGAAHVSL